MLLLDTCSLIWLSEGGESISDKAKDAMRDNVGALHVCAITAFEIALLVRKGRLKIPKSPDKWYADVMEFYGLNELPVTGIIAVGAAMLPYIHNDPCDRIILATARQYSLDVVTADRVMPTYPGVNIVW